MRVVLVVLLILAVGCGGGGEDDPFAYDADAPLDVREEASRREGGLRMHEVTYASPKGGRVPAIVVVPNGDGPFAGLIVQHGMPGTRRDLLPFAQDLARLGAVAVMIDAPFARRSGEPVRFDRRDRAEQIQLIVDLRRAVDLLLARDDVDADRIGYLGISYGGAMGGLLAGVEHRIAAFVLAVGDGGLVEHFSGPDDASRTLPKAWVDAMTPIEPLRYVARAEAPLLFLSGRFDEAVPPADARRYQRAAPESKQVKWYDSGHFLPSEAECDWATWLGEHIGIAGSKHAFC